MNLLLKRIPQTIVLAGILVLFTITVLIYSCTGTEEVDGLSAAASGQQFVGDHTCQSCHSGETAAWKGSHHDYAMKKADSASVRGDFGNVTYTHKGDRYRFYRNDGEYMVEAPGPNGDSVQYEITYTFGWTPLQQYLVDFGKGKLQALNIAWDTERKQWFALNPEEELAHGDWLHWTGGAMNWNTMCADCHSTNLRQNYIAETDSFHTRWSSINVSCEACHGPGQNHVDFMRSEQAGQATIERIRRDLKLTRASTQQEQIAQCASCHSLREKLTENYNHTGNFLDHFSPTLPHPQAYFADGQIKEEVYVYGSFLQSKMYANDVNCSDCHDPHSLKLKANVTDNSLCMQCHEPRYNSPDHHFHKVNTEASRCISCHMPGRYYMEIDFRRDHSFRVPRPDLTAKFGTPNVCNSCHGGRSPDWAAEAVERWYGGERQDPFSEILARADAIGHEAVPELEKLTADTSQPDIARATAVWYLGQFPTRQSVDLLGEAVRDKDPLVRNSAARALASLPENLKKPELQEALDDSVRAVRLAAAQGLSEFTAADVPFNLKRPFNQAMQEYRQYLDINRYFPQGQMNRGQFFEKQGQPQKAIEAYQEALEKDPRFNPARINLAYLYNRQGKNTQAENLLETVVDQEPSYGQAWYSLALLLAEQNRLEEATDRFEQAAKLMPDHARVRYNLAIAYQNLGKPEEAEEAYLQAIELAPEHPDYRYGICTLYLQQGQYREALLHARKLTELQPEEERYQQLLQMLENRLNK